MDATLLHADPFAGITVDSHPAEVMTRVRNLADRKRFSTLVPMLGSMLRIDGKPYSLRRHQPFEDLFRFYLADKYLFMTGRQVGKCLAVDAEQRIRLFDGREVLPAELKLGDRVIGLNDRLRSEAGYVTAIMPRERKAVLHIKTRLGNELWVSHDHKIKTLYGYTPAGELKPGSRIAAPRRAGEFGRLKVPEWKLKLTAFLIGDGSLGGPGHSLSFVNSNQSRLTEVRRLAAPLQASSLNESLRRGSTVIAMTKDRRGTVRQALEADGLWGLRAWQKFLPPWVFKLNRQDTATFLAYLWSTDGSVKQRYRRTELSYSSTSQRLVRDVQSLLHKFGIPSRIQSKVPTCNGKKCRRSWELHVETRQGWAKFQELMAVPGKPSIPPPTTRSNNNRDTIPIEIREHIAELAGDTWRKRSHTLLQSGLRFKPKYPLSRPKLDEYISHFNRVGADATFLEDLQHGDVWWDTVTSVTEVGERETFDITVDGVHSFLLNGVFTHNSASLSASTIARCTGIPSFNVLYVTPLYEQVRRLSSQYVQPMINTSPLQGLWRGRNAKNSVLQQSFKNGSNMFFSYAYTSVDRVRGLGNIAICGIDEIQDMNREFLPVIEETMSASEWGIAQYSGTPKTLDNTLTKLWQISSQAEWFIPCSHCTTGGKPTWNIPSSEYHLEKMIGPMRSSISFDEPATICHKCGGFIRPQDGRWIHRYDDRRGIEDERNTFEGRHVPQIVMPTHYSNPKKWAKILTKQGSMATNLFYNEVLGEPYDTAAKLVTETELIAASNLGPNTLQAAKRVRDDRGFRLRVIAVDWGGGGEEGLSLTTIAYVCIADNGTIQVPFGVRLLTPHDHLGEAAAILDLNSELKPDLIVHDYTGAGALRETFLLQSGRIRHDKVFPVTYVGSARKRLCLKVPGTIDHPRTRYHVDKSRSLLTTCAAIKCKWIRFFNWDYKTMEEPGLISDFTALIEEKTQTLAAGELYRIEKADGTIDDFAQAVNIGSIACWHWTNMWPNIANMYAGMTPAQREAAEPKYPWSNADMQPSGVYRDGDDD